MHRRAVVVAVLVLAAGCSAVPFGAGAPSERTDTVTPVPVTDARATAAGTGAPELPPGVQSDGQVDVVTLSQAHRASVETLSYTWTVRYDRATDGVADGPFVRRVVVGNETYLVEQTTPGPGRNTTLYVNESGGFLRSVTAADTRYDRLRAPGDHTDYAFADEAIRQFLDGPEFDVRVVERSGRPFFRLHSADGPPPTALASDRVAVTNFTATAYVTPDGFVRSLAADYDRHVDGDRSRVTFRYDYGRIGDSAPAVPRWTDEVPRRSTPEPAGSETPTADDTAETPTPGGKTETANAPGTHTATDGRDGSPTPGGDSDASE